MFRFTVSEKYKVNIPSPSMSNSNDSSSGGVVSGMNSLQGNALSSVMALAKFS